MTQWVRMGDLIACPEKVAEIIRQIERKKIFAGCIPPDWPNREKEFWKLKREGWSKKSLAKRFRMTRGRVSQIIEGKAAFPR